MAELFTSRNLNRSWLRALALALLAWSAMARVAPAQEPDSLRSRYLLEIPPESRVGGSVRERVWPAMSVQTPSGYGSRWGDWYIGAGYQHRARYSDAQDGVVGGGFGLGNPDKSIGLEVDLTSTSTFRQGFFKNDLVDLKLHRSLPGAAAIAVGWDAAISIGGTDAQSSVYVTGSKTFFLTPTAREPFSSLTLSAGLGTGRFRSEVDSTGAAPPPFNAFGSVGLRIAEPLSIIGEWNGQDATLGISIVPFSFIPFVITPAVTDLTGHAGDGRRLIVGAGFGFSFGSVATNTSLEK